MNKMKLFLFLALALAVGSVAVWAEDEIPGVANFQQSMLGVIHTSTATTTGGATTQRAFQTRRVGVSEQGDIMTIGGWREVVVTTGVGRNGPYVSGTSTNAFAVNSSSWIGASGCRGLQDNCNVIRLATLANPVYVDHVDIGDVVGGVSGGGGGSITSPGRITVRLFDSRGSTDTAFNFFNVTATSGPPTFNVAHWCSSGTVLAIDGLANVVVHLGKQNR